MLLELLASGFIWIGLATDNSAKLSIGCDTIELDYGGKITSGKRIVVFDMYSSNGLKFRYKVPMSTNSAGAIILAPQTFWLEELSNRKELEFLIGSKKYRFNLTGTKEATKKCFGDVAE